MRSCVCSDSLRLLHFALFAHHFLSYHPAHPRHLPRCGGQIPRALSPPLPSTTLSHGLNHGPVWKIQSFLLSEICTVILWQTVVGKAICENPIEVRLGEGFQLRMLVRTP